MISDFDEDCIVLAEAADGEELIIGITGGLRSRRREVIKIEDDDDLPPVDLPPLEDEEQICNRKKRSRVAAAEKMIRDACEVLAEEGELALANELKDLLEMKDSLGRYMKKFKS